MKQYRASPGFQETRRKYYNKPEYKEKKADYRLRKRYGITSRDKQDIYDNQDGNCAICNKYVSLKDIVVDHNHATGRVRGLLCNGCNTALGLLREDPETISGMQRYIDLDSMR